MSCQLGAEDWHSAQNVQLLGLLGCSVCLCVCACVRACVNIQLLGGKKKHLARIVLLVPWSQNQKISQHIKACSYAKKKMTAKLYLGGFHIYPPPGL